jgi:hypothetical protein
MALPALPPELVSSICRFLGDPVRRSFDNPRLSDIVHYQNDDFKSLRLTCKVAIMHGKGHNISHTPQEIHYKTMHDAALRYDHLFEECFLYLDEQSLWQFLHTVRTPEFCDRIVTVYIMFPMTFPEDTDPEGLDDSERPETLNRHTTMIAQKLANEEPVRTFVRSSEMIYLLVECFKYLGFSKSIERLEVLVPEAQCPVFAALNLAHFPRRVVFVNIHSQTILDYSSGDFPHVPLTLSPYIKGIEVEGPSYSVENVINPEPSSRTS